jgi:hypothetical protein
LDAVGRAATALLILAAGCAAADDLQRGTELAQSGHWAEAREAFLEGTRLAPRDRRLLVELAGVEYRQKNLAAAKRYLRRALALDPSDRYACDFLATIYYLEGNVEAAVRYWNRIGKPQIAEVLVAPEPKLNAVLLDSALTIAPGSLLTLDDFRTADARLDALDSFPSYRLDLEAHADERFDAALHWVQLPGWTSIVSAFRGVAYQTLLPELRDIGGTGLNWDALLRWDAQKRRIGTSFSGPLMHNAKWRYRWYADARSETWNAGGAEDFRMQRLASGLEFQAIPSWRLAWQTGVEVSSRRFMNLPGFGEGAAIQYRAGLTYELLRIPERRIRIVSGANGDVGRMLGGSGGLFSHARASLDARWLPKSRGDDYEVNARVRAGTTQGNAPFDELFMLGVERDNDLWLRGHSGTVAGKKGSAPVGRNYFLANWDFHKQLYRRELFTLAAGPFVDTGRTSDVFGRSRFQPWLVDTGLDTSVRVAGGLHVNLIYGRDLRGGGHVIYATVGR